MATKRIKDITNTAASVASDAYLAIDGTSNGTEKITRDNFRQDTADAFVAAPGTYNLAPLSGGAVEVAKGGTGATTAAGARTNLDVPSNAEVAADINAAFAGAALKITPPALYFNGSSSVVTVADDDKLSFTDGTNDLPFSVSAWVKMVDASSFGIVTKYVNSGQYEWAFWVDGSDNLVFRLTENTDIGDYSQIKSDATVTAYEGQWIHVAASYAGAGPTAASGNDFSAAASGMALYINGSAIAATGSNVDYPGMTAGSDPVIIGKILGSFSEGSVRDVKIFNRELTASEVAELARGNDLGFADEFGGANGGEYTSDFSGDSTDSWSTVNTTFDAASTVGGDSDNLKIVANSATATHTSYRSTGMVAGKRYRLSFDYYIPSGQSNVDGLQARAGSGGQVTVISLPAATQDAWTRVSGEFLNTATTNPQLLYMYITDAGNPFFTDAGADDYVAIRNVTITEIGTLADFRSERYDTSTNKLYDLSDNAFVGTGTSVSLTGREVPVYETGTWTPVFIGSTTSDFTYSAQEGYYMRIGNTVFISGLVTISALGTSAGNISVGGLPFTTRNTTGQLFSASVGFASGMAGLTSIITGLFSDGDTDIDLYDWGATGVASLTEANLTGATSIRFSGTYQIQ